MIGIEQTGERAFSPLLPKRPGIIIRAVSCLHDLDRSRQFVDHGFQEGEIKLRQAVGTEFFHRSDRGMQVPLQLTHSNPAAGFGPEGEPFLAAPVHLDRPSVILAGDMQIDHTCLQDALVKLADGTRFCAPGCFQRFMSQPIATMVEKFQTLDRLWMQGSGTIR